MRKVSLRSLLCGAAIAGSLFSTARSLPELVVTPEGIGSDGRIDGEYAFCAPAESGHVKPGQNKSLGVAWSAGPAGTKSYAVIMVDTDVPTAFDDAGKEGKTLPANSERRSFYHWLLYNIPASQREIPAGTDSQGVVQHGKTELKTPYGLRGVNDYAPYFASDPKHQGVYAGYDGPCPPWNDERIHHYHLKVFALDVTSLMLSAAPAGPQLMDAVSGHILAEGEVVGTYTLNPDAGK